MSLLNDLVFSNRCFLIDAVVLLGRRGGRVLVVPRCTCGQSRNKVQGDQGVVEWHESPRLKEKQGQLTDLVVESPGSPEPSKHLSLVELVLIPFWDLVIRILGIDRRFVKGIVRESIVKQPALTSTASVTFHGSELSPWITSGNLKAA